MIVCSRVRLWKGETRREGNRGGGQCIRYLTHQTLESHRDVLRTEWEGKTGTNIFTEGKAKGCSNGFVQQVNSMSLKERQTRGDAALGSCMSVYVYITIPI